ncbi:ABC transporter, permease protein [Streptococcus infantarius subsp. infantarius]|nr:ABC transporter, permease protein [Streptococcus infantarius subsp. infantarius]MCO4638633.1 ABC transporter, permease protein [Streptococcus infantarius subsp. infantarius]MCO4641749.1 ABC transporter, permease protein [Streptococcus infantarius subsp. infantarius]MCO4643968.1 ABC transporter, permease protein [Streptococcus infantarius subsp. infantarius]
MIALLKVEWIKTKRTWITFVLSIGMPVFFFLFFSGMELSPDLKEQKVLVMSYMLTMTAFSMSSFGFFSFPAMLVEDKTSYWLTYIEHSSVSIWQYYLSKVNRVLVCFLLSILATFLFGAIFRGVTMPLSRWLGSATLLLLSSLLFLAFGLLISQMKSQQLMTIVGDIAFLGLAIIGGSWMPIETFPEWMQKLAKVTPIYHVNILVTDFAKNAQLNWQSLIIVLGYAIIIAALALMIKNKIEVK